MAEKCNQIHISLDLLSASKKYLDFVKSHLTVLDLRREDVIRAALYRYQHFWLPLAAKYPDKDLEAPEDINWVWHCHMLSPMPYAADCKRLVGRVIGNESLIRSDEENEAALQETKRLWEETYPPQHPFFVDISGPVKPEYRDGETNFNAHILSNALRQKEFDYQVSLPHYDDPGFISSSVIRYKQFLYLRKVNPEMWVIPTYDVDFVWHSHQLCPLQYQADMFSNLGCGFNHGDVPPGLPPDAKLHYPDIVTRKAWVEEFGESVSLFGAGYRGENPVGKLEPMDRDGLSLLAPLIIDIFFSKVTVTTEHDLHKSASLKVKTELGQQKIPLFLKDKNKRPEKEKPGLLARLKKRDIGIRFDTSKNDNCLADIRILQKSSASRIGDNGSNNVMVDLKPFVSVMKRDQSVSFQAVVEMDNVTKLQIQAIAQPLKVASSKFKIQPGQKDQIAMTENLKSMWGPIPLPEEPLSSKNVPVNRVSFKVLDAKEQEAFTCRLLECHSLDQEGAQVFFHGKMVAVGHPIGGIQLPYPSHVSNKKATATLNPLKGEQAALIKNDQGDWGILVAHVAKEKKPPVNGTKGKELPVQEEETEYMNMVLWILEGKKRLEFRLPNENNEHELSLEGVTINMTTATVQVDHPDTPVAECLAIAFTLKIVWRLCTIAKKNNVEKIPTHKLAKMGRSIILATKARGLQGMKW